VLKLGGRTGKLITLKDVTMKCYLYNMMLEYDWGDLTEMGCMDARYITLTTEVGPAASLSV